MRFADGTEDDWPFEDFRKPAVSSMATDVCARGACVIVSCCRCAQQTSVDDDDSDDEYDSDESDEAPLSDLDFGVLRTYSVRVVAVTISICRST